MRSETITPRMLERPSLGVCSQKMMQHVEKCNDMPLIIAGLAGPDVIDNHVANFFCAMLLMA